MKDYVTLHEEIMKQKWVINGPLLIFSILSYIPTIKGKKECSTEEEINNNIKFIKSIFSKMMKLSKIIKIIDDKERIYKEIEYLCKMILTKLT